MTYGRFTSSRTVFVLMASSFVAAACSSTGSRPDDSGPGSGGQAGTPTGTGGAAVMAGAGSNAAGAGNPPPTSGGSGAQPGGATNGGATNGGATGTAGGGQVGGGAHAGAGGAQAGGGGGNGGASSSGCVSTKTWDTADPTVTGPFQVAADKNVGPLAGAVPDPVYGSTQQKFNVYRPKNLADSGYCHPILVWANGHTDNPEPNPPSCTSAKYCGSYLMVMNQMASHGFVVIASLSTITSQGDPLPTIVGLDWLLKQAEDPTSPYYHRLDTAHIGAFGHSEGGFSTSKAASDPRITAISTVSGSAANPGFHQPALLFCGGKDAVVSCDSVAATFSSITTQPAMLIDNLAADHGGWLYQSGAKGPDIFG
ncbi:MAG: hypothetical protein ABIQ16_24900, partial [Polyangiaceae bacterium]